ncbi:PDDEXK family nuclease [Psychrobacter vallis]|uniref:VRR-NUC domain-containing protein n=1 Tax=Psychrobacter vallis TaxID=248451 RepID=UPI001D120689|nr:VRR-NUC domain-containing protein [Psychrobacter vallis]
MARLTQYRKARVVVKDGKSVIVMPAKSEDEVQISIINWSKLQHYKQSTLFDYLTHIPNGGELISKIGSNGKRYSPQGNKNKAMGVQAGYPDLMLDIAIAPYHGLRIELKKLKGGHASAKQKRRIERLNDEGYYAVFCKGFDSAATTIKKYMAGEL